MTRSDPLTPAIRCPAHAPDFAVPPPRAESAIGRVLALSGLVMAAEILAGLLTGSLALLADGWHMATHVAAMAISAFAYRYMRRHAGQARFSFGPGKVSYLAAYTSGLLLAAVAVGMLYEATLRVVQPTPIRYDEALIVAVIGLAVNLASAWLLHGADHAHDHGHAHGHGEVQGHSAVRHSDDHNLRAAYMHVLADALTSVAAIIALLAGKLFGSAWLDPAVAGVGGLFILRWAWQLVREAAAVLLDRQVDGALAEGVRAAVAQWGGEVRDMHIWLLAPCRHALVLEVSSAASDVEALRARLRRDRQFAHVTIDLNKGGFSSAATQQTI